MNSVSSKKAIAKGRRRERGYVLRNVMAYGLLGLATVFVLVPILWGLSTSLKPITEVNSSPPTWLPNTLTFENYVSGALDPKSFLFLRNTVIVIALSLLLSLTLAAHAAWAVVRRKFVGKELLLFLMWATIMIPGISIIVPLYLIAVDLNLYDTYWILVLVYSAWAVPTLVWLLRGFIAGIPAELEEAAPAQVLSIASPCD